MPAGKVFVRFFGVRPCLGTHVRMIVKTVVSIAQFSPIIYIHKKYQVRSMYLVYLFFYEAYFVLITTFSSNVLRDGGVVQ